MLNQKEISIDVRELCKENQLNIINQCNIKEWSTIKRPAINRLGFELTGLFFNEKFNNNIIGWGTAESKYLDSIGSKEAEKRIRKIFDYKPPLVICSIGVNKKNKDLILKIANEKDIPIVFTEDQLSFTVTTLGVNVAEFFSREEFVHGSLVIINGIGVLIIGDSGIGKSEAVLELIQKGHLFVSDDSVHIKRIGHEFVGYPSKITQDILEARGLGLIDIKRIYGEKSIKPKTHINLVIELKNSEIGDKNDFDRLGNEKHYFNVLNGKINKIIIPVRLGRSISSLIEVATNLYISKRNGLDALKLIQDRIKSEGE